MSIKFIAEGFQPKECSGPLAALAPVMGAIGTTGAVGGTLGTALTIAGGVMGAIGSIQQGMAAKASADYNAQIAERNALIARQETKAAKETQDRERRLRVGANIARAGASGVGAEAFGDLFSSSAVQEELDLLTLQSRGLLKEQDYQMSAGLSRMEGKAAQTAGMIGAGTSLIGTASKVVSSGGFGSPKTTQQPFGPFRDKRYFV